MEEEKTEEIKTEEPKTINLEHEADGLYYIVNITVKGDANINIKQSGNPPPPTPPYNP